MSARRSLLAPLLRRREPAMRPGAIFRRPEPGLLAEEAAEVGLVAEAELVGDLLDAQGRIAQQPLGFVNRSGVDGLDRGNAEGFVAQARELSGRDAHGVGVAGHGKPR